MSWFDDLIQGDPNALDNWDLQGTPSGDPSQMPAINDYYTNQSIGPGTVLSGNPSSSAQDTLGLQQMGQAAGLSGSDLQNFVNSGGTMGSTAMGGGGVGTGAGVPFGVSGGAGGSATGGAGGSSVFNNYYSPQMPDPAATPAFGLADLMRGLPGIIGAVGANRQTDMLQGLADRQFNIGQPSRDRYEGSYAPSFTMGNDPGYLDALNQSSKANLYGLSRSVGNPALNPNAQLQNTQDLFQRTAYPALQQYRQGNASAGGLAQIAAGAPAAATAAINSGAGTWNAIGGAAADIFNPKMPLDQAMATMQRAGVLGSTMPRA